MLPGQDLTIRSREGNPEACVIDCAGGFANQRRGFYFDHGETHAALVAGLTISHGYELSANRGGAAIYCAHDAAPTIRHCILRENTSAEPPWDDGGTVRARNGSAPVLEQCVSACNTGRCG